MEKDGRAAEKGNPLARPFQQPSLMCSPLAHPAVQPTGPPFCAVRQSAENSCFSFGNTALQSARPAGPPFSVILMFVQISECQAPLHKCTVNL